MNRWIFFIAALFVAVITVRLYVRYNKKRYPYATDFDIEVWRLYALSLFVAGAFYYSLLFLPLHLYPVGDYPDETQERKIQRLIDKDNETTELVNELRDATHILLLVSGLYIWIIARFIGKIQKKRNMQLLSDNPETKAPLGL
jgi:hypothetical protein